MTVFPGFGGQAFIAESLERIAALRQLIQSQNPNCELEVDGGIDLKTCSAAITAGANVIVAGTAIFAALDGPEKAMTQFLALASSTPKPWAK